MADPTNWGGVNYEINVDLNFENARKQLKSFLHTGFQSHLTHDIRKETSKAIQARNISAGAYSDPSVIAARVSAERALIAATKEAYEAEKKRAELMDAERERQATPQEKQEEAVALATRELNKELKDQNKLLSDAKKLQDPAAIKARVDLEKQMAESKKKTNIEQKKLNSELDKARKAAGLPTSDEEEASRKKEASHESYLARAGYYAKRGIGQAASNIASGKGSIGMTAIAGGALGGALGGPMGAQVGAAIGEAIPTTLAKPAAMAIDAFRSLGSALSSLTSNIGPFKFGLEAAGNVISGMGKVISTAMIPLGAVFGDTMGRVFGELGQLPKILGGIAETMTSFGALASPAMMDRMKFAIEDFQAVIGGTWVPVMDIMQQSIRTMGDIMANLLPNAGEVRTALEPLRQTLVDFGKELKDAAVSLGPLIRSTLITGIQAMGSALQWLTGLMSPAVQSLKKFADGIKILLQSIGINTEARSSMGAAARAANVTSWDQYKTQLMTSAYSVPGEATPEQRVPGLVEQIATLMTSTNANIQGIREVLVALIGNGQNEGALQAGQRAVNDVIEVGTDAPIVTVWKMAREAMRRLRS